MLLVRIAEWLSYDFRTIEHFADVFDLLLKVSIAAIYTNLMSVYSGCPNFCNGSCTNLCIINVSKD